MVCLYINTKNSELVSVSLKENHKTIKTLSKRIKYGSQALLPLIIKLLKQQGLGFKDLTGIEVEVGPGSFTGLRVGASVAQALGFTLNIPVNGQLGKPVRLGYT